MAKTPEKKTPAKRPVAKRQPAKDKKPPTKTKAAPEKKTRRKPKKPCASSTGRVRNVKADQTNWRRRLQQARIKFDDEMKEVFLRHFAENNLKGEAAKAAGVTLNTVKNHYENDPDFAEAYDEAVETYRDKFVGKAMQLAHEGIEVRKFNKDGDLVEERRDYPIRLIELGIKKYEPTFRDKSGIELSGPNGTPIPSKLDVHFIDPPDWENVEFDEETGRPKLRDNDVQGQSSKEQGDG